MVFKYEYDQKLWQHGGVRVTYKERLSATGAHSREAEFAPMCERSLSIPPVAPLSADDAGITIDDDACTLLCKLMVDGGCFAMSLP